MCVMDSTFEPDGSALTANDDGGATRPMPELPSPGQRWTTRRKASVVAAVRGGWVPIEEVCRLYALSAEEIVAWERDLNRHGLPGLRATRLQIYRDIDKTSCVGSLPAPPRTRYVSERRFRRPG
jgi:Protein of unknown function (DUF1153)